MFFPSRWQSLGAGFASEREVGVGCGAFPLICTGIVIDVIGLTGRRFSAFPAGGERRFLGGRRGAWLFGSHVFDDFWEIMSEDRSRKMRDGDLDDTGLEAMV
jgi:hypothetical protein